MLHILLLILKIIGIILGCVIGLALLILAAVLFVSVRYRGWFEYKDAAVYTLKAHWLLGAVYFSISNRKDGSRYILRIFGYPILDSKKEKKPSKKEQMEENEEAVKTPVKNEDEKNAHTTKCTEAALKEAETEIVLKEAADETSEIQKDGESQKKSKTRREHKKKKLSFADRLRQIKQKFIKKLKGISAGFKRIKTKKERLFEILSLQSSRRAIVQVKMLTVKLLRHLRFRKLEGKLHYGFNDPYITGRVLAVLGMLYPIYSENVEIQPDFQNKVLEGNLYVRGRIRIFNLLWCAVKLKFNKDLNKMIRDIKNL